MTEPYFEIYFFDITILLPALVSFIIFFLVLNAAVRTYSSSSKRERKITIGIALGLTLFVAITNIMTFYHIYVYYQFKNNQYQTLSGHVKDIEYEGKRITKIYIGDEYITFNRGDFYCMRPFHYENTPFHTNNYLSIDYVSLGDHKCVVRVYTEK